VIRLGVSLLLLALALPGTARNALVDDAASTRLIEFDVYLDDSRIGFHRFELQGPSDGMREVVSKANFDVKFLFVTAFKYRHDNAERWVDGCLSEIDARTNSNGKRTAVMGERTERGFVVETSDGRESLPECVMTFAYWNPSFLKQSRLLNAQTGEYLDVAIEQLGSSAFEIGGRAITAKGYTIRAKQVDVTVWYTANGQWIALESPAKGGRTIRYELS